MTRKSGFRRWPSGPTIDSLGMAWLMAGAALLLSIGLMPLDPDAGTLAVIAALIVAGFALFVGWRPSLSVEPRAVQKMLGVCIVLEGFVFVSLPIFSNAGYQAAMLVLTLAGAHTTLVAGRWRRVRVGLVLAGFFVVMCWMLASTGIPPIDVIPFQQEGSAALLEGVNPYTLRFQNIFGPGSPYYAEELQIGNQLAFGFPYPPLSLLLAIPGYALAGDYRYGAAAAITITAALLAWPGRSQVATGAALLIIFAPITQVVLYWGWSEPFVALTLATTSYIAARSVPATPAALGLLVAVKQYCAPVLLVGLVLLRQVRASVGRRRMALVPIAVAGATVLPFAIWNLPALAHSTVIVQLLQPFRRDAVSVPALLARADLAPTSPVVGLIVAALALLAVLRWAPRTVSGFFYATAVVLTAFFLFSKQAFPNYYFFSFVALACGIAATRAAPPEGNATSAQP